STTTPTATPSTKLAAATSPTTTTYSPAASGSTKSSKTKTVDSDCVYGPTKGDQLTLLTSATRSPLNNGDAVVVTATLLTEPFEPTPQGARSDSQTGRSGDSSAWPTVVLSLLAFVGVVIASIMLYRRMEFRIAYILTIAPLVVLTIIAGEA